MDFIDLTDYDASIHAEILNAITREDNNIIEVAEKRAIEEMKGYLKARYDVDSIFSTNGNNRNPVILMMAIDIAIYHLHCIHNPRKLTQLRQERYDRAIEWLKQVNRGQVNPTGLPVLTPQTTKGYVRYNSNPKRGLHY